MTSYAKYRVYCVTDAQYEYTYDDSFPVTCPVNGGHTITTVEGSSDIYDVFTITSADSPFTVTDGHFVYACDTTSGNIIVNLPLASLFQNAVFVFIKTNRAANTLTIQRSGSDLIDASTSLIITAFEEIQSNGVTDWSTLSTLDELPKFSGAASIEGGGVQSLTVQSNGGLIGRAHTLDFSVGSLSLNDGVASFSFTEAGEANTASNVGVGGVGVFKQKTGVNLEFRNVNAGSNKITITNDSGNNEIDVDVAPANILIGSLSGAPTGAVVGTTDTQTLTNKTLTSTTNNVAAKFLHSATTLVDVSSATAPTSGQVLTATSGTAATWQTPTADANTASNVGVGGVGVFKQKTGVNLEFRNINAGSNKITITNDSPNNEIDVDVAPANILIGSLSGAPTGAVVGTTDTQTLTNKTITDTSNNVTSSALFSASTTVNVSSATAPTSGQVLTATSGTAATWQTPTAEANTASNVGVGGVGVFKQKTGVNLEFRNVNAGSNKITITNDTPNNEIDVDVAPANILIGSLSGAPTGAVVGTTDTQTLTNKTLTSTTNDVAAKSLHSATTIVDLSASTAPTTGQFLVATSSTSATWQTVSTLGEANTASNVGVGGVGVFKQKTGVNLEFRNVNAGSNKITITDDSGNNEIDVDVAPANILIGSLSGAPTGDVVGTTDTQTLTNKTMTSTTNNITASALFSATTTVTVNAATAPTAGQVLTATSGTVAQWSTPSTSGSIPNTYVTGTVTFTTTSLTDTILTGMTSTPAAGTYLVMFSAATSCSTGTAIYTYTIYVNGVAVADTVRSYGKVGNNGQISAHTQTIVAVPGGQAIDIRVNTTSGTLSVYQRSLILVRLV